MMHINNRTCFLWEMPTHDAKKRANGGGGGGAHTVILDDFHASHMSGTVTDYGARECNSMQQDVFGTSSNLFTGFCKAPTRPGTREASTLG